MSSQNDSAWARYYNHCNRVDNIPCEKRNACAPFMDIGKTHSDMMQSAREYVADLDGTKLFKKRE